MPSKQLEGVNETMQMHVIPLKELLRLSVQVRSAIHQCQCDQSEINETAISCVILAAVIVFQAMQIRFHAQSVQLYSQVQSNTYKHLHHPYEKRQ